MNKSLRALRNNQTLKEVSQATGLSVSYISDLEHDRRKGSIKTLQLLADYYDYDYEALCRQQARKKNH